jgi:two-component system, response regulator PdtaR
MNLPLSSIVVLVVEDEALVLFDTAAGLRAYGCEVVEACDADEAIGFLEMRDDVSVVFTDVNMPGPMDGLKLARTVERRWPGVRVIVTSGKSTASRRRDAAPACFIGKPYETAHVASVIESLMAA